MRDIRFWVVRWGGDEFVVILAGKKQFQPKHFSSFRSLIRDKIDDNVYNSLESFIGNMCKWRMQLCMERTESEMKSVLKRVGIAGGWSLFDRNFELTRIRAERAMYVAKEVIKKPLLGRSGSVALEFTNHLEKYNQFLKTLARSRAIAKRMRMR